MIAAFLGNKFVTGALICVGLLLLALTMYAYGAYKVEQLVREVREHAIAERDAVWKAEIAKANEAVADARAAQTRAVAESEAAARASLTEIEERLRAAEAANATLPGADSCGLDHDRVRALRTPGGR